MFHFAHVAEFYRLHPPHAAHVAAWLAHLLHTGQKQRILYFCRTGF